VGKRTIDKQNRYKNRVCLLLFEKGECGLKREGTWIAKEKVKEGR
jgi:hypothetical protein